MFTKDQSNIFEELTFELTRNSRSKIFCLHGNAGSGKTFIIKELEKNIDNVTFIDYDGNKLLSKEKDNFKYKLIFSNKIKETFTTSIFKFIFNSYTSLYSIIYEIHQDYGSNIGEKVYFLMQKLLFVSINQRKVLIVDNLNFISSDDLKVFNILLNKKHKKFHTYFYKIINNTNFIFIYSDNYYKSDSLEKFLKFLKKSYEVTFIKNKSLSKVEVYDYISKIDIQEYIIKIYLDKIYNISFNGNLALINASIKLLLNNQFKKDRISNKIIKRLDLKNI